MKIVHIPILIKNLIANSRYLLKYNIENDIVKKLNNETLKSAQFATLKELIELYFTLVPTEQIHYTEELSYIKQYGITDAFPYTQNKTLPTITSGFDPDKQLPFVMHHEKKLYFPQDWNISLVEKTYRNYIERENLLGGNYTSKAPHQYETDSFQVEKNDIVVDIGCAEALFALDTIEKSKHTYLFESDEKWIKPLKATFSNYLNKVTLVSKYIGDKDSEQATTLQTFFKNIDGETFFIKMDIEGAEKEALSSSQNFLKSHNNFKIACCTYHRANHSDDISQLLQQLGYNTHFSDGFMLYFDDDNQVPPYFRRGLIRASRQNIINHTNTH